MYINQLKIIGCSGHCKVVIDALSTFEHMLEISLCDSNIGLLGKEFCGFIIDTDMKSLSMFTDFFHIAIGNNVIRKNFFDYLFLQAKPYTIIHSAAVVSKSSHISDGTFVAAKAVLGPDSFVGHGCIINHGAIVDHEVIVGEYSHIAPNSTLGGNVIVGKGVLVGAGAVVLPGVTIGDGAIIAAGAAVLKNVKEFTTVKGVPAL